MKKEIKLLQKLSHKNLVNLHDAKRSSRYTYLFLEYCEEGDLSNFIKKFKGAIPKIDKRPLDQPFYLVEKDVRHITKNIVEGLCHLEEMNVIHRDIKMDNILVKKIG